MIIFNYSIINCLKLNIEIIHVRDFIKEENLAVLIMSAYYMMLL